MIDAGSDGGAGRDDAARPRFVVGVGASAGGLEAVEALLATLRLDSMAVVVVQHLSPTHDSALQQILARATSFSVATAADGMVVTPNCVYVIPPNAMLTIADGRLQLSAFVEPTRRSAIDAFFRSLAEDQGARAVGVVLSGTGNDGTLGLQAIKEAGGVTFVQQPGSARFDGMPRAAFDSGWADHCGSPTEIGHELMRLSQPGERAPGQPEVSVDDVGLRQLLAAVRDAFGHDLTQYKPSTLERRTERRMALHRLARVEDYLRLVRSDPDELRALYRDLLIGVTNFFRDHDPFAALASTILPAIVARKRPGASIRMWVAACSTGEEAYSLAISAAELLDGDPGYDLRVQIFATDVDDAAVQSARRGLYPATIELDLSPERLQRFFVRRDAGYQINRRIRDMVVFSTQDVTRDAPFSRLDLLSCRNLLIYLKPVAQQRVLRLFHYALQPLGYLLLGSSETVGDSASLFSLVDGRNKIYACKQLLAPSLLALGGGRGRGDVGRAAPAAAGARPAVTLGSLADQKVLDLYGPPGVVVDEALDVLHFRGRTGRFLAPAPGAASLNLLRLARPELQADLRRATREALATGQPALVTSRISDGTTAAELQLEALPIVDPATQARCLLVLFHEPEVREPPPPLPPGEGAGDQRVHGLALELALTKDHLQSTIDELEGANEALKSSNEELQSSNEELECTNEELETSKEEVQSTNEELTTLNEELNQRMAELQETNDDLHNVMTGVDNAVVIAGADLRIRRFTRAAERLFGLGAAAVGRPLAVLAPFFGGLELERLTGQAIESLRPAEHELQCADGRWHLLRIVPYKTLEHAISGAVLVLGDIDVRKRSLRLGEDVAEYAAKFLEAIGQALAIVDGRRRIVWVNDCFYQLFGILAEETIGAPLSAQGWDDPTLAGRLDDAAATGASFRDLAVRQRLAGAAERTLYVGGSRIPRLRDEAALILVSFEARR